MSKPKVQQRFAVIISAMLGLVTGLVVNNDSKPPAPKLSPTAGFPNAGVSRLAGISGCSITEGTTGGNCVVTISPPAPAGSTLTFALGARTYGKGAWTPIDSSGAAGGGTGADVMTEAFGVGGITQTISIATGATVATLPIVAVDDDVTEEEESAKVTLTAATGITIDPNAFSTNVSIIDNDRTVTCDPVNYGATPNSSGDDDWSAIQQAINCASAGAGHGLVLFGTVGTYDVWRANDGTILNLADMAGITISGYGSTIKVKSGACTNPAWDGKPFSESHACTHNIFAYGGGYNGAVDTPRTVIQGLTLDGNRQGNAGNGTNWQNYESQHTDSLYVSGATFYPAGSYGIGRVAVAVQDVNTKNSPGDGISIHVKVDLIAWHMTSVDDFRGGLVATGGDSKMRVNDWTITSTDATKKTGIDFEIDGAGGVNGRSLPIRAFTDFLVENLTLDGDLDVGGYLAEGSLPWCTNENPGPGPTSVGQDDIDCGYWMDGPNVRTSKQVFRNVQMTDGPTTIQAGRYHDLVQFENSTLVFGNHTGQDNRIVSGGGEVAFIDTQINVNNSRGFANGGNGTQGLDIWWGISCIGVNDGFCRQGFPGKVSFLRTSVVDTGAPNSCVRQYNKNASWNTFSKIDSGPWNLDCGQPGYTGVANVDTGTGGPAPTTTTTAAPPTTTASTTTTTTTPVAGQHKEAETCTLGASVSTNAAYPGGQVSSAVFGGDAVGGATLATCTLTSAAAGNFPLTVRYWSSGTLMRPLTVNGVGVFLPNGPTYPATGGAWATVQIPVTLQVGTNTFVLDTSYLWVDWIELPTSAVTTTTTAPGATTTTTTTLVPSTTTTIAPPAAGCVQIEAETPSVSLVNWSALNNDPTASDGGYVTNTNQVGSATWSMAGVAGGSTLSMRLRTGGSGANRSLKVNGVTVGTVSFSPTDPWAWVTVSALTTVTGTNTVQLVGLSNTAGGLDIDAVKLCSTSPTVTTTTTTTTTTSTTTTTTTIATTTTSSTTRRITLLAWSDRDADAVRDSGEPVYKQATWRLLNSAGKVLQSGNLATGTGYVTVPVGANYRIRWTLPGTLGATTPTLVTLPSSGAPTVRLGVCCSSTIGS